MSTLVYLIDLVRRSGELNPLEVTTPLVEMTADDVWVYPGTPAPTPDDLSVFVRRTALGFVGKVERVSVVAVDPGNTDFRTRLTLRPSENLSGESGGEVVESG